MLTVPTLLMLNRQMKIKAIMLLILQMMMMILESREVTSMRQQIVTKMLVVSITTSYKHNKYKKPELL